MERMDIPATARDFMNWDVQRNKLLNIKTASAK
jgi:hypothetical protein